MRKILSIDGGGIRGIIPAIILAKIEKLTGKATARIFDLVAGTSTGGILALGLCKPDPLGQPQYSAEDLVSLYEAHGQTIFDKPSWRRLFGQKYSASGIDKVLDQFFGETRLRSALSRVLVTSYEIERRTPFFFRSVNARRDRQYDFRMKDAARATSAAPTYFPPLKIECSGRSDYYALVDGGVYANNPAICALVEARKLFHNDELLVVSLGTGALTRPLHFHQAKGWGLARWAKPLLEIVFDGVSSTVDYQLRQLLPRRQYYRFQPTLQPSLQEMDNTTPSNLRDLKLLAEETLRARAADVADLCEMLLK
ncbi:MAG TPA: CBASS cGAMP-activated phospholipase [Bryobacteraceae bacterium]|nr:CBASS cGAMP-activated phospholipase [Bryobacteraceae bacterium]